MKALLCDILLSCLLAGPAAKSIDELTYGTALYAYYQEDYSQALLEVLVAERQQRLGDDAVRFELAKGSFAFQQGMYRMATETFASVGSAELSELDRMRLSFHLAREHYRRGEFAAMEERLADVNLGATWLGRQRRHPEVTFMRAEAALARGDFAAADDALENLPQRAAWQAYGLFNLGVAQRHAGAPEAARDTFARLAQLKAHDAETWDLVQRGRLALAVMARQTGAAVDAQAMLGTLPGAGRYRDQALVTYGNLAMARDDHELAARIWLTLLEQDGWSSGYAAAQLGLPMSLERLASPAHALDRYRQAELAFAQRLDALQQVSARVQDPVWVDGLLDVLAEPDEAARTRGLARFESGLDEEAWLTWLAAEDVHQILVEWRELNGMAAWLDALPDQIQALEEVTVERRRRSAAARLQLSDSALMERREALEVEVAALASDLEVLAREPSRMEADWMLRLADEGERELIGRLSAMADLVSRHMPDRDRPPFEKRLDRLMGVVFWQIADERSARVRALRKRLDDGHRLLAEVNGRIERLERAESRFAAGVETDFLVLTARADEVSAHVAGAMRSRRQVLAEALQRGLDQDMAQTRQYLLTARIAIARATDQLAAGAAPSDGSDS
jgi:hypothetical protein